MSVAGPESPVRDDGTIQRFGKTSILFHWIYALCFLTLLLTGLGFAYPSLGWTVGPASRLIHRIAAVGFVVMPLLYLVGDNRSARQHIKEAFSWSRSDWHWLAVAVPYHFSGKPKPPPQGFLNAGQKLNYIVVVLTFVIFVATGAIMWFARPELALAQREIFRWAAMLHSLAMFLAFGMFLIHIYMSGIHPFTRAAFRGMIDGRVPLKYALYEHPKWAEQHLPRPSQGDD